MVTPLPLFPGALLTNAAAIYYTSPPSISTLIKKLTVTSNDAAAGHTLVVWIVPVGGAPTNANLLIAPRVIGPYECFDITPAQNKTLLGGWMIYAQGDDNVHLNIMGDGVKIS